VEDRAAPVAHPSAGQPPDELLVCHFHVDDRRSLQAHICQCRIQCFGLRNRPREAVEQKALATVRLGQALAHDADHEFIGNQLAGVHELLGLQAQRRALANGGTQHIAGGDVRHGKPANEELGLSALPRSRRAKQDHVLCHARFPQAALPSNQSGDGGQRFG